MSLAQEKEEEYISDLEVYVDCLSEITEEFKSLTAPSYLRREEVLSLF
jgi:hypothetical protein